MHSQKKETLYETRQVFSTSAYSLTVSYKHYRCVEFVYFPAQRSLFRQELSSLDFFCYFFVSRQKSKTVLLNKTKIKGSVRWL